MKIRTIKTHIDMFKKYPRKRVRAACAWVLKNRDCMTEFEEKVFYNVTKKSKHVAFVHEIKYNNLNIIGIYQNRNIIIPIDTSWL